MPEHVPILMWPRQPIYEIGVILKAIKLMIGYFHANPVRRQLVPKAEEWKWSSAGRHEGKNTLRPDPIDLGGLLGYFGGEGQQAAPPGSAWVGVPTQATERGLPISSRTVRRILQEVDLQPHRTRFWKTARLDAEFLERAVRILWCYSYANYLAQRGYWVVCEDELPNFQILKREPIRRAIPGSIEQQEFEYTRLGTINILVFLVVHSGRMHALCVDSKDAQHYIAALRSFRRLHRNLEGVYLIHDGDPSHTAGNTQDYLADWHKWWRPCRMPVDASWLNQAESLLQAFEGRYLKRDSWRSREDIIEHINSAWPEYNRLYAHPFDWEWSIPKLRQWFAKHAS